MANHQHICRYCDELHFCRKGADECFDKYLVCDDCEKKLSRFLWLAVFVIWVIGPIVLFFKLIF